jgi:hypothetical protein
MTADQPFDWRAHLQVHPAADLFPLLSPDELKALAEDIKKNGLQTKIVMWTDSYSRPLELVDGRNRLDALALMGWLRPREIKRKKGESDEQYRRRVNHYCPIEVVLPEECLVGLDLNGDEDVFAECGDPYAAALSFNVQRRHLTAEQRREVIAKVLKAKPEQSNRQIAKQVRADDKTVATVRRELESTAEIPQLENTIGLDGKTRKAKKAGAEPKGNGVDPEQSAAARKTEYEEPKPSKIEPPTVDGVALAKQFREHIAAAFQILDREDWLPEDVTGAELGTRRQMKSNLQWQVSEFEKMVALFKWPVKPSEESRKLAAKLKRRAETVGCTMSRKGRQYEMNGGFGTQLLTLNQVSKYLDQAEGKVAVQMTTACGMPLAGVNNAAAVERYEKATGIVVPRPDNWTMRDEAP